MITYTSPAFVPSSPSHCDHRGSGLFTTHILEAVSSLGSRTQSIPCSPTGCRQVQAQHRSPEPGHSRLPSIISHCCLPSTMWTISSSRLSTWVNSSAQKAFPLPPILLLGYLATPLHPLGGNLWSPPVLPFIPRRMPSPHSAHTLLLSVNSDRVSFICTRTAPCTGTARY